jgi:F1F0 ATPase subunit 2
MNNIIFSSLPLVLGLLLGLIFFCGLWWTVQRGIYSKSPARWFLGSMLLRISVVLAGFYYLGGGDWQRLVTCLFGFIIGRFIVMRLTRSSIDYSHTPGIEAVHAP